MRKISIFILSVVLIIIGSYSLRASTYRYNCKVDGKTYSLRVDDKSSSLEWRGIRYSITRAEIPDECAKFGWRATGKGKSFLFCTMTKGVAILDDGEKEIDCGSVR
jgi:hypothetical protein